MKKTILFTITLLAAMLFLFSINSKAALYPFSNTYSGMQEVPVNASPGTGSISGVYNDVNNTIFFTVSFSGLLTNTSAAHFHIAPPGMNAGAAYGYTGFPEGVSSGTYMNSFVITEEQEAQLKNGLWYSNIHTTGLPGGEIRTQIILGSVSNTLYTLHHMYSGAQETIPNASPGTGVITGVYNSANNNIFYHIVFSGLLSPTVAAHFHAPALPGVNAAVVYANTDFPISVMEGNYFGTHTITDLQETQLLDGLWYSNIHSVQFPGGEIRTQIALEQAPAITCPDNIVTNTDAGLCSASVTFEATATGLPAPSIVYSVNNAPVTSPYVFPVGTTTVNAVAANSTGTANCTFTVRVNEVTGNNCNGVYCDAKGKYETKGFIKQVFVCYAFNNISGWNNGYGNFLNRNATTAPGKLMGIAITPGCNSCPVTPLMFIRVWIDWNGDGDFGDAGELVFSPYQPTNIKTKAWIRVPATAKAGKTRMRIAMSADAPASSCGDFAYGEVEDYSISIAAARFSGNDVIPENFDELNGNTFTIYPNPVADRMIIERMAFDEDYATNSPAQMQIMDANGKVVMQKRLIGLVQPIDVYKLASGIYFLTIKTNKGISTQKIIIHH